MRYLVDQIVEEIDLRNEKWYPHLQSEEEEQEHAPTLSNPTCCRPQPMRT